MANIARGLGRGAQGAAIGATIGGPVGGVVGGGIGLLTGLFGGDDEAEQIARQRAEWYERLMRDYSVDPQVKKAMQMFEEEANRSGLGPQEKAMLLESMSQSGEFARGREGAIESHMRAAGGGRGSEGASAIMQEQASQAAAGRVSRAGTDALATADRRRLAAMQTFLQGSQRNQEMLNQYRIAAAGIGEHGKVGAQDFFERKDAANQASIDKVFDIAGAYTQMKGGGAPGSSSLLSAPRSSTGAGGSAAMAPTGGAAYQMPDMLPQRSPMSDMGDYNYMQPPPLSEGQRYRSPFDDYLYSRSA